MASLVRSLQNGFEIAQESAKEGDRLGMRYVQGADHGRLVLFRGLVESEQDVRQLFAQKGLVLLLNGQPEWLQLFRPIQTAEI